MADYPIRVRPEIVGLATRPEKVTLEEYRALRCNSWEWEALVQNLSDEALAHAVRHCADNCSVARRRPAPTYNDAIVTVWVPELLRRLTSRA